LQLLCSYLYVSPKTLQYVRILTALKNKCELAKFTMSTGDSEIGAEILQFFHNQLHVLPRYLKCVWVFTVIEKHLGRLISSILPLKSSDFKLAPTFTTYFVNGEGFRYKKLNYGVPSSRGLPMKYDGLQISCKQAWTKLLNWFPKFVN